MLSKEQKKKIIKQERDPRFDHVKPTKYHKA
jgi:hypothetical protein